MARFAVDSSILLRLFIEEPDDRGVAVRQQLREIVERGDLLVIHPLVLAEVVFVLNGPRLRTSRDDQLTAISSMLDMRADLGDSTWLRNALGFYEAPAAGWLDCLLAAFAVAETDGNVITLDNDFRRFTGVRRFPS